MCVLCIYFHDTYFHSSEGADQGQNTLSNYGVVVLLPILFRGMGSRRNSRRPTEEFPESSHVSRSGLVIKNGKSSTKDGAPERLRFCTNIPIRKYTCYMFNLGPIYQIWQRCKRLATAISSLQLENLFINHLYRPTIKDVRTSREKLTSFPLVHKKFLKPPSFLVHADAP